MPDYNPDKEAHRDHKWIVHNATRNRDFKRVQAAERDMAFDREGRFSVADESVAAEIRERYPREVTVSRVSNYHPADRGHKYFFTCPAMPWHKEKENEKHD
jgi:hypothetical protein